MLNPEFRLLDPEHEHLERLMSLSGMTLNGLTWLDTLKQCEKEKQIKIVSEAMIRLNRPGIHSRTVIVKTLREIASSQGIETSEPMIYNWPESILRKLMNHFGDSARVYVIGILDAEGIWASGLFGTHHEGLDFLSTFRLIWSDEPELASKQTLDDLAEFCQVVQKRYSVPVCGLYIYKDEFMQWGSQGWSNEVLQNFIHAKTVNTYGF